MSNSKRHHSSGRV